ncbi:MAG: hypothetical protein ACRELG_12345 [Gemmataceae bacterium]
MSLSLLVALNGIGMGLQAGEADSPKKQDTEKLAANAQAVLAAIVKAASENHRLPERNAPGARAPLRRSGDDLTVYYVRAAASAARRLPEKEAASAFLLALGIALDESSLLRSNLLTRGLWRKVEPDDARKRRLAVLGSPTLHGRHDLAQHFSVSAALTAAAGPQAAESAGLLKEMLDARGGSGFSFADLSADFAGIAFARRLLDKPSRLADLAKAFRIGDYALAPRGLPEGLTAKQFEKRYGSLKDERFQRLQTDIRKRIEALPGYRDPAEKKPDSPP